MGLFDLFRLGKVVMGTVQAVRGQRSLARELAAMPMDLFVARCLADMNRMPDLWQGRARPAHPQAAAISAAKRLPPELSEFYSVCDGFASESADFPVKLLSIEALQLGADARPRLSERLQAYWQAHDNLSEKPGLLSVLPPDDLAALAVHAADSYLAPAALDLALPLCVPTEHEFVVVLLASAGEAFARGIVLEVEGGSATRYPDFKTWLATRASLYGSMPIPGH